jgi:hypothetical protein
MLQAGDSCMLEMLVRLYVRVGFVNASGALILPYPEMELKMARSYLEVSKVQHSNLTGAVHAGRTTTMGI